MVEVESSSWGMHNLIFQKKVSWSGCLKDKVWSLMFEKDSLSLIQLQQKL